MRSETESYIRNGVPKGQQPEWGIGNKIIAENGPDRAMFWARLPFILIACLPGILVYLWGHRLLGGLAGLCATLLYTTDPTILAHSYLVTMDVGLAAFTILFLFTLWRYVQKPTRRALLFCGLALGAALCAKFSAVLLLPTAALLLLAAAIRPAEADAGRKPASLAKAGRNDPCPCGSGKKYKACHGSPRNAKAAPALGVRPDIGKRCALAAGAFFAMCAIAVVVIEIVYLFPRDPWLYIRGLALVNADHNPNYRMYMAGELQRHFTSYFAVAYLLKEPLASILLAAGGLAILIRSNAISRLTKLFILLPPAVLFAATTLLADNLGLRYIMPVLPFAHLLGGLALATLFSLAAKWGRWVAVALCAWLVLAVAGIYPDRLSYFNESACLVRDPSRIGIDGGTECGVLWLDDSNVDWGQGLKQLKAWLDRNAAGRTVRMASLGTFPPEAYGIPNVEAKMPELTGRPFPGLYAISAHFVARIPAHERASAWLRQLPPVAIVGHGIYVFDVVGQASWPVRTGPEAGPTVEPNEDF